jgi:hypothetical protein
MLPDRQRPGQSGRYEADSNDWWIKALVLWLTVEGEMTYSPSRCKVSKSNNSTYRIQRFVRLACALSHGRVLECSQNVLDIVVMQRSGDGAD